jgi:NAD(P)-dependent dehydrogenase (short-subunit alcohol dehydrogenase family)
MCSRTGIQQDRSLIGQEESLLEQSQPLLEQSQPLLEQGQSLLERFFEGNRSVVELFLAQQEKVIDAAAASMTGMTGTERSLLFSTVLETNRKVLADFLSTQEAGLSKLTGEANPLIRLPGSDLPSNLTGLGISKLTGEANPLIRLPGSDLPSNLTGLGISKLTGEAKPLTRLPDPDLPSNLTGLGISRLTGEAKPLTRLPDPDLPSNLTGLGISRLTGEAKPLTRLPDPDLPSNLTGLGISRLTGEARLLTDLQADLQANLPEPKLPSLPASAVASQGQVNRAHPDRASLEEWLRAEICRLTGFPGDIVTRNAAFEEDLGLNSITMMELWMHVVETFPNMKDTIERHSDQLRKAGTFGEMVDVLSSFHVDVFSSPNLDSLSSPHAEPHTESSSCPVNKAEEMMSAQPESATLNWPDLQSATLNWQGLQSATLNWPGLRSRLIRRIAALQGIDEARVTGEADLEDDLGLDIFTRQHLLMDIIAPIPYFGQAGRELLNVRTLDQLESLLLGFVPPCLLPAEPVERFILVREKDPVPIPELTALPKRLLLAGRCGNAFDYFYHALTDCGLSVFPLYLSAQEWNVPWGPSRERFALDDTARLREVLIRNFPDLSTGKEGEEGSSQGQVFREGSSGSREGPLKSPPAPFIKGEVMSPGYKGGFRGILSKEKKIPPIPHLQKRGIKTYPYKEEERGEGEMGGRGDLQQSPTPPVPQPPSSPRGNGENEWTAIIFLAMGDGTPLADHTFADWLAEIECAATGLFGLAQSLSAEGADTACADTAGGFRLGVVGSLTDSPAWRASRAVAKSLSREWPKVHVRSVWLEDEQAKTRIRDLLKALFTGPTSPGQHDLISSQHDLILGHDALFRQHLEARPLEKKVISDQLSVISKDSVQQTIPENSEKLKTDNFKLITSLNSPGLGPEKNLLLIGGGSGITAEVGHLLARLYHCRIIAIGRTPWPDEKPYADIDDETIGGTDGAVSSILMQRIIHDLTGESGQVSEQGRSRRGHLWQGQVKAELLQSRLQMILRQRALLNTRQRIEAAGGSFSYYSADAVKFEDLERVLAAIHQEHGPVHGLIHGAGLIDDQLLARKSVSSFRKVLYTKALSIFHLYRLLRDEPLEFVQLFSSLASHTGTPGQTDYAAANEVLNAVAHDWNQAVAYPVRSILWSVWTEAGLAAPGIKSQMKRLGLQGISNQVGVHLCHDELINGSKSEDWVLLAPRSTLTYAENLSLGEDNRSGILLRPPSLPEEERNRVKDRVGGIGWGTKYRSR